MRFVSEGTAALGGAGEGAWFPDGCTSLLWLLLTGGLRGDLGTGVELPLALFMRVSFTGARCGREEEPA